MDRDLECFRRYLDGDESGIEELLDKYGKRLIAFIYRFVRDEALAEELMEDSFCDLIIKRDFSATSSLKTYLYAIAKNKAYNELRHRKRFIDASEEALEFALGCEDNIADKARARVVFDMLSKLKREHRTVLYLLYYEQMSYRETAKVMGRTEGQIKSLAFRAKKAMRALMEKEGYTYEELV